MKHRTALMVALSMLSVVVAGTAAVAANLGILESSAQAGAVSPIASMPSSTSVASTTEPSAPGSDSVAYQIPDVGVVSLIRDGDSLTVESVEAAGWDVSVKSEGAEVEIELRSGDRVVTFKAEVDGDMVVVDVVEESATTSTTEATTTTATTPDTSKATTTTSIVKTTPTTTEGTTPSTSQDQDDDDDGDDDDQDKDDDQDEDDDDEDEDHGGGGDEDDGDDREDD